MDHPETHDFGTHLSSSRATKYVEVILARIVKFSWNFPRTIPVTNKTLYGNKKSNEIEQYNFRIIDIYD